MTFGTTEGKVWVEALPTMCGATFTGRTFSRLHIADHNSAIPIIGQIWATSGHAVETHAHDADELLYVLSGVIEVNGQRFRGKRGRLYSQRHLLRRTRSEQ